MDDAVRLRACRKSGRSAERRDGISPIGDLFASEVEIAADCPGGYFRRRMGASADNSGAGTFRDGSAFRRTMGASSIAEAAGDEVDALRIRTMGAAAEPANDDVESLLFRTMGVSELANGVEFLLFRTMGVSSATELANDVEFLLFRTMGVSSSAAEPASVNDEVGCFLF